MAASRKGAYFYILISFSSSTQHHEPHLRPRNTRPTTHDHFGSNTYVLIAPEEAQPILLVDDDDDGDDDPL